MTEAVLYYGTGGAPQRVAPGSVPGAPIFTFGDSLPTNPKEGDTHYFSELGQDADGNADRYINPVRYDGSAWMWAVEPLRFYVLAGALDEVHVYDLSGTRQTGDEFDLAVASINPVGIAVTSSRIYVANNGFPSKVYVYDLSGNRQTEDEFDFAADNNSANGIAVTSSRIYVADNGDDKVYVYDLSGTQQTEDEFPLHADNASASGLVTTSTRIYVADKDDHVYVYDLSGTRQTEDEFDLASGNNNPGGIAVAGDRVYVTQAQLAAHKVYVYDLSGNQQTVEEFGLADSPTGLSILNLAA